MENHDAADEETWEEETDDEPAAPAGDDEGERPWDVAPRTSGTRPVRRLRPLDRVTEPSAAEASPEDGPCTSLEQIYTRFEKHVWSRLVRPDVGPDSAEGIHREAFLTMDKLIDKAGKMPTHPQALLNKILDNLIRNYLRTRARRPRFDPGVDAAELPSSLPDAEESARAAEKKAIVHAIFGKMPKLEAQIMIWVDFEGYTHKQLGEMLGCPERTAQSRHRLARARFAELARRDYTLDELGGAA